MSHSRSSSPADSSDSQAPSPERLEWAFNLAQSFSSHTVQHAGHTNALPYVAQNEAELPTKVSGPDEVAAGRSPRAPSEGVHAGDGVSAGAGGAKRPVRAAAEAAKEAVRKDDLMR